MTITFAAVFGSFTRVDITVSHQSSVDLRIASDSASCTLCGSSQTILSPPSPVAAPPTEVESLYPDFVLSNLPFAFWSHVNAKRSPQFAWNQGDSISIRHLMESRMTSAAA